MMKYTTNLFILITFILHTLMLTACGGGSNTTVSPEASSSTAEAPSPPTPVAGKLKQSSEASLMEYFQQLRQQANTENTQQTGILLQASAAIDNSASTANTTLSTTNVQESGVDEADILKTSHHGQYIYAVAKAARALASPPILESNRNKTTIVNNSDSIRIMDAQNIPLTEITRLTSSNDKVWNINGLYVDQTNHKLAALSANNTDYHLNWFNSTYFAEQTTDVLMFDIADPRTASLKYTLSFDGSIVDSRRNGDVLYIVLRHFPAHLYNPTNTNDTQSKDLTSTEFLPHYRLNTNDEQPLVLAENCYQEDNHQSSADIITMVAINLASDDPDINSQCYIGKAEAIYASQQALYLATTKANYHVNNGEASYENNITTDIHKFAYNAMNFDYRGSGEVRGHLGYQQNRKSFRFSEHNGILRVVTFDPEQWNDIAIAVEPLALNKLMIANNSSDKSEANTTTSVAKSPVSLTLLEEDNTQQALNVIAQLPNANRPAPIGLPQEKLYASRFIGDKAYFVTFRVTDPLYVIDLSDPTDPFIAGELKIDGYSDYLQPISETLLLGIGKDAIPSTDTNGLGDGRGAWHQGVKLSLIDVSDPTNPLEVDKHIIGKRGTESTALYNHHALTSLKIGDTQRIAFPLRLHEKNLSNTLATPHPSQYYGHTHTGLYRFDIDLNNQTITEKPAMIISKEPATSDSFVIDNDRSVMINNTIHYLYNGQFTSRVW